MNNEDDSMGEWKNLVYISIIGDHQTKSDIARAWNISINGGPLYQKKVTNDIEDMEEKNLIEKRGSTLYADLESEEFENSLREHFEDLKEQKEDIALSNYVLNNFNRFLELIRKDKVRKEIFDLETVVEICNEDTEVGKSMNIFKLFDILVSSYSAIALPRLTNSIDVPQDIVQKVLNSLSEIFKSYSESIMADSVYNVEILVEKIEEYEEKNGQLEYMMDAYKGSVSNRMPFDIV